MKKWMILMLLLAVLLVLGACGQTANGLTKSDSADTAISSEDNKTEEPAKEVEDTTEEKEQEKAETAAVAEETGASEKAEEEKADTSDTEVVTAEAEEKVTDEESSSVEETQKTEITETVWLYFADDMLMNVYRTEESITVLSESELSKAALDRWIDGPAKAGLYSLVPENTEVQSIEEENGTAIISFSAELLEANAGSTEELFFTEQVAMIMQQFGYEQTKILVNGNEVDTFFGHMDATKPIEAGSPEDYEVK